MTPLAFEPGPWTAADKSNLINFLGTQTGQRLVNRLVYSRPEYSKHTSIEERALQSAKLEGFEAAVSELLKLTKTQDNG